MSQVHSKRWQVARLVRSFPALVRIPYHLWRFIQPKYSLGVVAVVMNEQQEILLVEHVMHPVIPWGLPGGWIGHDEDPQRTVERELSEELKLSVKATRTLLVAKTNRYHIDIAFLCEYDGEIGELSFELLQYKWVAPKELPRMYAFQYRAIQIALGNSQ